MGAEAWDGCLRQIMMGTGEAKELHAALYHETHEPAWKINKQLPSQVHNIGLAKKNGFAGKFSMTILPSAGWVTDDDILRYYRGHRGKHKPPLPPMGKQTFTNSQMGIGDTLVALALAGVASDNKKQVSVYSRSESFAYLKSICPPMITEPTPWWCAVDHLYAKHDMGNGHFIQGIQRAAGFSPDNLPKARFTLPLTPVLGRVLLHFEEIGRAHV